MTPKPIRVLVLEDRPEDMELILRSLRKAGYAPESKRVDTEAAFRSALGEGWEVVLSDYSLPQFSAPRALEILQEHALDIPFLVITGSISEEVAVECMKRGASDYLLKDRLVRLGTAVEQALHVREARRQRHEAEEHLRLTQHAVDHSPVAVLRADLCGRITYANHAACRWTGFDETELLQRRISDLEQQSSNEAWESSVRKVRASGATTYESTFRRKDGGLLPVEVTASYLEFAGEGRLLYFVSDITERKRAVAILVESEKMRTVAGLATGVAHEINNPLAGVLQNTEVVLNRLTQDTPANRAAAERAGTSIDAVLRYMETREIPEMLRAVRESGQRAADIVQNMLRFSRGRSGKHAPHRLDELLDRTVELARSDPAMREGRGARPIRIVREYDQTLPPVACDGAELQQVFFNILKNAAQALQDALPDHEGLITIRTRRLDDRVVVEIEDNGPGMSQDVAERAFEPFFTTKPVGDGTGLGLFVCYFIVTENHRGEITIRSRPGEGSRVLVTLLCPTHI